MCRIAEVEFSAGACKGTYIESDIYTICTVYVGVFWRTVNSSM